ncbi:sigma factor [Streptomyces sp. NPDC047461]|uniref:sigma factor n=1 Tax=Streptomyces sp. NPDC047461 TaxID=3155619 RepID=UPI0033D75748
MDSVFANFRQYLMGWGTPSRAGNTVDQFRSGLATPQFNGVVRVRSLSADGADVTAVRKAFANVPWWWWVGPDSPADTADVLRCHGGRELTALPVMVLPLDEPAGPGTVPHTARTGLRVEPVRDDKRLAELVRTYRRSMGVEPGLEAEMVRIESRREDNADIIRLAAVLAGRVVGTTRPGRTAGHEWAPRARPRGPHGGPRKLHGFGRRALDGRPFHREEFPMPATGPQTTTTEPAIARPAGDDDMDAALDTFLAERTRLFRIAYRILGDVTGAEDVVQEVWLRWQLTQREEVDNTTAFLVTATTRLAINVVRSARHRHEVPVEPQLAFGDRAAPDPVLSVERSVAVEGDLALLMARLTPDRLAAYVLRKGFGYAYAELASLLRISAPNARVVVHRAQARLECGRERPVPVESHRRLAAAFWTAAHTGDLDGLVKVLAPAA